MTKEQKHAIEFWDYATFSKVIKFVESIYPRSPKLKDKISFWKKCGSPIVSELKKNKKNQP